MGRAVCRKGSSSTRRTLRPGRRRRRLASTALNVPDKATNLGRIDRLHGRSQVLAEERRQPRDQHPKVALCALRWRSVLCDLRMPARDLRLPPRRHVPVGRRSCGLRHAEQAPGIWISRLHVWNASPGPQPCYCQPCPALGRVLTRKCAPNLHPSAAATNDRPLSFRALTNEGDH